MDNPITHTPGPWHAVGPGEFSPDWVIRDIVVGDETICSVYSDDADKDGRSLADAKLIAAAPDLLEALKEMVRMYEDVEPAGGWQGVYDMSLSAIKKATGK